MWQPEILRIRKFFKKCKEKANLPLARDSSPKAFPTCKARSMSKELPNPVEEGKQLEGTPLKTSGN